MTNHETRGHISVLLHEAIDGLRLKAGDVFLDATLGNAGHTLGVWKRSGDEVAYVGLDADPERVAYARKRLAEAGCRAKVFCENFGNLDRALVEAGISKSTAILFDLGLNSEQLESSGRGFSFLEDEPLLMTFGEVKTGMLTAQEIVNHYDEESLEKIFREYGEERQAHNIARTIVHERKHKHIGTTFELIGAIQKGYRGKYPKSIHFATRTFQALRIAVNDELGALTEALAKGFDSLSEHGRMAVISFHSLEDRIVKRFFRNHADAGAGILVTKRPIVPGDKECGENPRARSAKLRILEKM